MPSAALKVWPYMVSAWHLRFGMELYFRSPDQGPALWRLIALRAS